jgi:polyferredoxin
MLALRVLRERPHRYVQLRRFTLSITMVLLYLVPWSGLAQADLVGGNHRAAFGPAGWILPSFLAMVIVAALFWAATIALTAVFGRVFCGFGCLVGHSARLADNTASSALTGRRRVQAWAAQVVVGALFAGGIASWWGDLTLVWRGTTSQAASAIALYLVVFAAVLAHGRWWRWGFCKQLCPIGLYYSVVGQGPRFGVRFDAASCNDCNLCDKACPVGLQPRELERPYSAAGGAAFTGMPARNHCLVCGECVRACEISLKKSKAAPALNLSFGKPTKRHLPIVNSAAQPGKAQPGKAQPSKAQPGKAQPGKAQPGKAQPSKAQPSAPPSSSPARAA